MPYLLVNSRLVTTELHTTLLSVLHTYAHMDSVVYLGTLLKRASTVLFKWDGAITGNKITNNAAILLEYSYFYSPHAIKIYTHII